MTNLTVVSVNVITTTLVSTPVDGAEVVAFNSKEEVGTVALDGIPVDNDTPVDSDTPVP